MSLPLPPQITVKKFQEILLTAVTTSKAADWSLRKTIGNRSGCSTTYGGEKSVCTRGRRCRFGK